MTLTNAFKAHRMVLDRWMDSTGRIHHGTPPSTGTAMSIATHTFHGGGDELPEVLEGDEWWLAPGAMDAEREAMRRWCPTFTEIPGTDETPPSWRGTISTPKTTFEVVIAHRRDHGLPLVLPGSGSSRLLAKTPHRYLNGRLCVADESDWDAGIHTAATVVGWAAHWFDAYIDWLFFHAWPLEAHVSSAA